MIQKWYYTSVKGCGHMSTVSSRLKKAIEEKGMSYSEIEKMTGIAKSVISRYVNGGTNKIPIERVKIISNALNVDPYYIIWGTSKEEKEEELSDVKKAFIEEVKSLPDEKVKALIAMMKAFKES